MVLANNLAYYDVVTFMSVKSFVIQSVENIFKLHKKPASSAGHWELGG
jgi:hypothetical protein